MLEVNDNIMLDTHVYCTHCKHFRFCDEFPYCQFGDKCDNWNFEESKPYQERPKYEPKEERRRA